MIAKLISVKPLPDYTLEVAYDDGLQGQVSLKHLAHKGVFRAWDNDGLFRQVHIDDSGAIAWNEDLDICPDSMYLKLRGLTFAQWEQEQQKPLKKIAPLT